MTPSVGPSNLTDAEWMFIEPLLPRPAVGGAAGRDLRLVVNSILFLLRCGAALRTAPPWSVAELYYARWQADGTWGKVLAALQGTRPVRPPKDARPADWPADLNAGASPPRDWGRTFPFQG